MRKSQIVAATFSVIGVLASACGGGDSPSAPAATPQSVTITSSSDRLFIGASETFSATATMSDGSTRSVTGTWGTDAPGVATVDASTGRVTGVGSGMVTVFVDYQGRRGTKLIRGLPNYQGTWSGSYAVRSCSQSGQASLVDLCGATLSVNRVLPTNLNLTQDGDRVQGRFFLGTLGADASGPVQGDGRLLLTGVVNGDSLTIDTSWSLDSSSAGRITGGFSLLVRVAGLNGDARVAADIRDLNRTSNLAPASLMDALEPPGSREDVLRAIVRRR